MYAKRYCGLRARCDQELHRERLCLVEWVDLLHLPRQRDARHVPSTVLFEVFPAITF